MTTTPTGVPAAMSESGAPAAVPARGPSRLLHPDPMVRRLARLTLLNCLGNGLSLAVAVLFFTRVLGLSAAQLGFGLTVAGLCGVAASIPAGRAADRWGIRRVLVVLVALEAVGTAGYALVDGYVAFVLLACAVTAADRGSSAVRNALYAEVLPADRRVAGRAYLRVVTNVGMCLGTALGAVVLQVDTRAAYVTAILLDALSFAVVAVLYGRIRIAPPAGMPTGPDAGAGTGTGGGGGAKADPGSGGRTGGRGPNPALRNGPFLAVTALNAVLCLQFAMLEVGVPLWIVKQTQAPRIVVAGTLVVNTVLVVALQVRATRGTERPELAARACGRGGLLLAGSSVVLGLAHGLSATAAAVVVLGGIALQALGEVLSQAGGWALGYDLAGEGAHGSYQGVFNAGTSAAMMIGPVLVSTAVIGYGLAGWAVLGAVFAAAGLAMAPAVRWAARRSSVAAAVAAV
ncbi:MFS transporter [Kitasatospora sp. NBC_00240]|uniref:MFS transporter n=1 Tax=Kitasatospora sp. NBC_00240 TaxID=2903567 RepID=UPI00224EA98E|nr:MFS transporter [Kitasatospora sp. NBC_00240]MCX5213979.1 MFS transporter [Kitasatospora sp. NBC_00240]